MRPLLIPIHPLLWRTTSRTGAPAERIHRLFLETSWRRRGLWGKCQTALGLLVWPLLVLMTAAVVTVANGARVKALSGRMPLAQFMDQIGLAFSAGVLPPWYYIFDLYHRRLRTTAAHYIHRYEVKRALYTVISRARGTFGDSTLTDKAKFHAACARAGLPTAPLVLWSVNGQLHWPPGAHSFPECDLFGKPAWGRGGSGAELWRHVGQGQWERAGGRLCASELAMHFHILGRRGGYVVEERLTNHPDLADLNCGALATVRVLSILDEKGEPEVTNAVLRMPSRPGRVIDNFHAGGIAAAIDLSSGTLGQATGFNLLGRATWHNCHPGTHATIQGKRLPHWPAVLSLARDAHRVFHRFVVVGWDIAILETGPRLVEANSSPDLDLIQRPSKAPLGNARFGILFVHHVEQSWQALLSQRGCL